MKEMKLYTEPRTFIDKETKETIAYDRFYIQVGNVVVDIKPAKGSKAALMLLAETKSAE